MVHMGEKKKKKERKRTNSHTQMHADTQTHMGTQGKQLPRLQFTGKKDWPRLL